MAASGAVTAQRAPVDHFRTGLVLAVASAFTFAMSGPLGKSLMVAGWSPTAAVTARLTGGALLMTMFATAVRRTWLREALSHWRTVLVYGAVPIAGAQLFYFNAVSHLSVGVALLLEYTAPLLVVGWLWVSTRRRPSQLTLAGVTLAVAGIVLVLGLVDSSGFAAAQINVVGVAWGMAAAVCAACYFLMSERATGGEDSGNVHPVTLAAGGLAVGAAITALLGLLGVMPMTFATADTVVAGWTTSWLVPVVALGLVPTAIAYTLGIMGIARLRPRFASLVGLSEVMFAVLAAWVLLGESIAPMQALGGVVVLSGLALARTGDRRDVVAEAMWPETPHEQRTEAGSVGGS